MTSELVRSYDALAAVLNKLKRPSRLEKEGEELLARVAYMFFSPLESKVDTRNPKQTSISQLNEGDIGAEVLARARALAFEDSGANDFLPKIEPVDVK